ncbi:hypothetical protein AA0473_0671 [Acetobacter orleanensis NRIC 0473]|nr:hypothetical protein AA0473_0671 [Acetobacter orleanensis NRIC 0473]
MHWVRHPTGDIRRDPDKRLAMLNDVVQHDAWIVEGLQFKWADSAVERADYIVILDIARWKNIVRILRRFITRQLSLAHRNRGTLQALREEMHWSADYYDHERQMLFEKTNCWPDKVRIIRSHQDSIALMQALQIKI